MIEEALQRFAEDPAAWGEIDPRSGLERLLTDRYCLLFGTSPAARGQGAYRALVRARWDEAVQVGQPALVVHAGAMSRPILERLGFHAVAELQ